MTVVVPDGVTIVTAYQLQGLREAGVTFPFLVPTFFRVVTVVVPDGVTFVTAYRLQGLRFRHLRTHYLFLLNNPDYFVKNLESVREKLVAVLKE